MGEVVQFPKPHRDTLGSLGACPKCGGNDGVLNIEREHWARCDKHQLTWMVGENLFSSWRDETQADWDRNLALIWNYGSITYEVGVIKPPVDEAPF